MLLAEEAMSEQQCGMFFTGALVGLGKGMRQRRQTGKGGSALSRRVLSVVYAAGEGKPLTDFE